MQLVKLPTSKPNLYLRVSKGHFAATHCHTNYYIDVTLQKYRLSEAESIAQELANTYRNSSMIDTILCLDGMEIVGTCLAKDLTQNGIMTLNSHETIYVVTPEFTSTGQMLFRENISPMIVGKHVLVLAASVLTGGTAQAAMDAIRYYGGNPVGIAAIFTTVADCGGYPVTSVFNTEAFGDYMLAKSEQCPLCKQGQRIQALINSHGYSSL